MYWSLCLVLLSVSAWTASAEEEDTWWGEMQAFVDEEIPDNFERLGTM
jgi:hypothetical protein